MAYASPYPGEEEAYRQTKLVQPGTTQTGTAGGYMPPSYLQYQGATGQPSTGTPTQTPTETMRSASATTQPAQQPYMPAATGGPQTSQQGPSTGPTGNTQAPSAQDFMPGPKQPGVQPLSTWGNQPLQSKGQPASSATSPDQTLNNLGNVLSQHIANPSRFDLPEVQKAFDFFKQDLSDQAKLASANAIADAASRGVYYGSPLTTSLGDIQTQFQRGLGALATNLGLEQAQTQGQDLSQAINQGLQFGGEAMQGQNLAFNQAMQAAGLGYQGAPTETGLYGGALGAMTPLLAYGQYNPQAFQSLGALLAQG